MANVCVIGAGHAGLVTASCFADLGHQVVCLDIDEQKVSSLEWGHVPFFEPGLGLDKRVGQGYLNPGLGFEGL